MPATLRVANASGYRGDDPTALARQVRGGPVDYVTLDFLAEITMVILQRQRARDAKLGYAYDFVAMLAPVLRDVVERRVRVVAANAYLGAWPIAEALASDADIVVTGRTTDAALTLGPLVHELGWAWDDWDRLAAGTVAGHVLECGAQATGGNLTDWQKVPPLDVGYPVAEVAGDGTFTVTKHAGTGGLVSRATVTERLLYEIDDPARYLTPDVTADFRAFNFPLRHALGGGGTLSLRADHQGKTLGQAIIALELDVPEPVLAATPADGEG